MLKFVKNKIFKFIIFTFCINHKYATDYLIWFTKN